MELVVFREIFPHISHIQIVMMNLIWLLSLINEHQKWNRMFERKWTKPNVS